MMMRMLMDDMQEEARTEGWILGVSEVCREFGLDLSQTAARLRKTLPALSQEEAEERVRKIWSSQEV